MHILKIIHGYPKEYNAGSEIYTESICNELSKKLKVSIFTREENIFKKDFEISKSNSTNPEIYYLNIPREKDGYRHEKLDFNFEKLILSIKPDVAHIGHLNHLSTGIVEILFQKKIPILYTLHDFWLMCPRGQFLQTNFGEENFYQICDGQEDSKCAKKCYSGYFSGIKKNYEIDLKYWTEWIHFRMEETKSISKMVNLFIAPSNYLRNRFINEFQIPEKKIILLNYGFKKIKNKFQKKNTEFTFGYIGTHIPAKGINILIEAFLQMKENAILKIWGRENSIYTNSLKKLAASSVKNKKIIWMGEYENSKIHKKVFSEIDVLVVPSIWGENSPLVIHEAEELKIPVITSNLGGMKELVSHQLNGLLFERGNILDLGLQMDYAVKNPIEMKKIGEKGYLNSKNGKVPTLKNHSKELEKIYKNLLEGFYD